MQVCEHGECGADTKEKGETVKVCDNVREFTVMMPTLVIYRLPLLCTLNNTPPFLFVIPSPSALMLSLHAVLM